MLFMENLVTNIHKTNNIANILSKNNKISSENGISFFKEDEI